MKQKLVLLSCLLAISSTLACNSVYAEPANSTVPYVNNSNMSSTARRYISIFVNEPSLSISNREASIRSSIEIVGNYSYEIITVLQRSTNRSDWINANRWTETGYGAISTRFTYDNPCAQNLYYRVECTIRIYNSNGSLIEEDTQYSSVVRCT